MKRLLPLSSTISVTVVFVIDENACTFDPKTYAYPEIMPTLTTSIEIAAPIDEVWAVLTNFKNYESWNHFTPKVETSGRLGDLVTLHVRLNETGNLTQSHLQIERFEPYTLTWGRSNIFVKAHRTQTLTALDSGLTRYESSEPFGGLLGPIIVWMLKDKLMRGYRWAAEGLKEQAEKGTS